MSDVLGGARAMSLVWIVITSVVVGAVPKVVWRPGAEGQTLEPLSAADGCADDEAVAGRATRM